MADYRFVCELGRPELIETHWLAFSAVPAINRNSFTAKLIGQFVGLIDSGDGGLFAEIYGLADRCVTVLLEGRLHPNVPLRLDVVGAPEDVADFRGDLRDFLNTAGLGKLFFQLFAIEAAFFCYLFENLIYLQHF